MIKRLEISRLENRGYTLIELVVSITIFMGMLLIFLYIMKNTILFVNLHKQETVLLNNMNDIKSKITESMHHDKIRILPSSELSSTWVYSMKDNVVENEKIHTIDTIALSYEDTVSSWGLSSTQTGILVLWVATWGRLIVPPSSEHGFLAIKYLSNTGKLLDYTVYGSWPVLSSTQDYINTNVKIHEFRYSLVNDNAYLRIDMTYDNDIDGKYEQMGKTDEYYFSGSTYLLRKID